MKLDLSKVAPQIRHNNYHEFQDDQAWRYDEEDLA
jgi:hypothetical protein